MFKKLALLVCVLIVVSGVITYNALLWKDDMPASSAAVEADLNKKIKSAILGDGVIELTEDEINSAAGLVLKGNERVKGIHIDIQENKVLFSGLVSALKREFMVKALVTPVMKEENIIVTVDRVSVGRVKVPDFLVRYGLGKFLPEGMKLMEDGTINAGNRILMLDSIESMSVKDNSLKIVLQQTLPGFEDIVSENKGTSVVPTAAPTPVQQGSKTEKPQANPPGKTGTPQTPAPTETQVNTNPNPTPTPTPSPAAVTPAPVPDQTQSKIAALKTTNGQLYNVQNAVKSSSAKNWVGWVISVNSKMIKNPDGNYSSEINSAKGAYKSLPPDIKDDIKSAALNNLDISSVRYLVNVYGM